MLVMELVKDVTNASLVMNAKDVCQAAKDVMQA